MATDNIIRQSQLITTYGPGAMIDLPDYSVICLLYTSDAADE